MLMTVLIAIFSFIANVITEGLNLATSGPLEGRYLFFRIHRLLWHYLKKCSSVLGYSYIMTKSYELFICDKLSPEHLINSMGTYEALKNDKMRCTMCQGTFTGV